MRPRRFVCTASIAALLATITLAPGAITTWDGSDSAAWSAPANWDTGIEPTSTEDVVFPSVVPASGAVVTLSAGEQARTLQFDGAYTLTGGNLTLAMGTVTSSVGATATIASELKGSLGLTKSGTGTLILAGTNTYSGGTFLTDGILSISNNANLGVAEGGLTFTGVSTLQAATFLTLEAPRAVTIDPAATATIDTQANDVTIAGAISGSGTLNKTGTGTLTLTGTSTFSGPMNVNTGTFRLDPGSSISASTITVASGGSRVFHVNGGTLNVSGLVSVNATNQVNQFGVFLIDSGIVNFNGGWRTNGDRDATLRINGGTVTATNLNVQRNEGSLDFTSGIIVAGGQTTVGTIGLGTSNSWGAMSIEGGTLTANGAITIANQLTSGRGGGMRVTNGRFISTDTVDGIVLAKTNGANANNVASAAFSGGTSTVEKFTLGFDSTVTAGSATINVNGGSLYLGSGGIVKNGAAGLTTAVNLTAGLLGAKADWSSTVPMSTGTGTTNNISIKAADAGEAPHNITLGGVLSGSSGFTKIGSGTLILAGNNTYTGGTLGTIISAGTLQVGNGGTSGTLGTSTVSNEATLAFNRSDALTVANTISGGGAVVQSGTGITTFTGTKDYTGPTTITGGKLNVDTTLPTSLVTVATGGALGGTGPVAMATVNSGGKLAPGDNGVGTLTLGSLSLSSGAALDFEFSSLSTFDQIVVSNAGGLLLNGGALRLLAATNSGDWNTAGSYKLFQFSGILGGAGLGALSVANQTPGYTYSFGSGGGFITLTITSPVVVSNWNNAAGGSWATTTNWTPSLPNAAGETANFGSAITAARTVTLDGNKTVGTLQFSNATAAYTIAPGSGGTLFLSNTGANSEIRVLAGNHIVTAPISLTSNTTATVFDAADRLTVSGVISGAGSLAKSGSGTLVISGQNTYAGGTAINSGTLQIGHNQALSSAAVTFAGNATLQAGVDALTPVNAVVVGNGITATVDTQANTLTLPGTITDTNANGALNKLGTGKLVIPGANTYAGPTTISGGTLSVPILPNGGVASPIGKSSSAAANLVLNGGSLEYTGAEASTDREFTVGGAGGGILASGSGAITFASLNPITLTGTDTSRAFALGGTSTAANTLAGILGNNGTGATSLTKSGPGTWVLTGANTFTGETAIAGGKLRLTLPQALAGSTLNYNNQGGTLAIADGVLDAQLGGLAGAQPLALENETMLPVALTVGGNGQSTEYSGALTGGGSLTKTGSGALTLSGPNTYTGSTTVTAGTLRVNAGGAFDGTASLAVSSGSTFNVAGGSFKTTGATTIGTASNTGIAVIDSGTADLAGVTLANFDGSRFQINGGTVTMSGGLTINRNNANGSFGTNGFIVTGGTTTTAGINLGSNNSWGTMQVSGGTITNTGQFLVGNQVTANRGGRLRVTNGTLISTDPAGLILANRSSNVASAEFSGGESTFEKVTLVADSTITGASATLTVNGGTVYLGSGGIVANTGGGSTAAMIFSGGTIGAKAAWSSGVPEVQLTGGDVTLRAAEAAGAAHDITLTGALTGFGGVVKTGAGTLTLSGNNSYTGGTTINDGALVVAGSLNGSTSLAVTGGSLRLGAANVINDSANLALSGGALETVGFSDLVGALTLAGTATIDLGDGASILRLADSKGNSWGGVLRITNWTGSPLGGGADQLFFGVDATALTPAQIGQIQFINPAGFVAGTYAAKILSSGEIVTAIPEPASASTLVVAGLFLGACWRRRNGV